MFALVLSVYILGDKGVCHVYGGGFAGMIQEFVKDADVLIIKKN
ncbi:MAG: hypothetical protein ACI4SR_06320 [Faecalibacillus sp.]